MLDGPVKEQSNKNFFSKKISTKIKKNEWERNVTGLKVKFVVTSPDLPYRLDDLSSTKIYYYIKTFPCAHTLPEITKYVMKLVVYSSARSARLFIKFTISSEGSLGEYRRIGRQLGWRIIIIDISANGYLPFWNRRQIASSFIAYFRCASILQAEMKWTDEFLYEKKI